MKSTLIFLIQMSFENVVCPFRRVWQQNEPCNFTRVSNILKKHIPFFRVFIDPLAMDKSHDAVNLFPSWKNNGLSYQDLIDVWLNTRIFLPTLEAPKRPANLIALILSN